MNIIDQKPIGKVILNENTPNRTPRLEHFLIPYYQRGYRWEKIHVIALLNDIYNFMRSDEKKYCLQPIVVVPALDHEGFNIWEVIDGQQRLITMNIIFNYINRPKYSIIFEKRDKSTDFLDNLSINSYSDENPDFHFMSQAHKLIKEWFEEKTKNDVGFIDEFNATLTKKVEIIWYQVEELTDENETEKEAKKIDIFNRLNIGKIPLTDAELIRALLLSKIKYGLTEREAILRQAEVSAEWHRIEMELRQEEFWYFLNKKPLNETPSTIEFLFRLIAQQAINKYSTYLWFENEIRNEDPEIEKNKAEELWKETKKFFGKLKFWFEDHFLYHHLGYVFSLEKNTEETIRSVINDSETTKSKFKQFVWDYVSAKISNIELDEIDELTYTKKSFEIYNLLFLHNVLSYYKNESSESNRFPFYLFNNMPGGWSIEHIHAQESKEMKEQNAMRKWLEDTYDAIKDIRQINHEDSEDTDSSNYSKFINEIIELLKKEKIDDEKFNILKLELIQVFDSDSIHYLDNLALLSKNDNAALNNSIFPVKRNKILELEKKGRYIPIATKNVFLKYYSEFDLQPYYWSKKDKENYYNNIKEILNPYFTKKESNE
ncbi:MAG: DUF262 domain-containing protein [Chitinophagales bacterium]|nr:DUF262 domain-containing protein [Chitinophagales bacterium]